MVGEYHPHFPIHEDNNNNNNSNVIILGQKQGLIAASGSVVEIHRSLLIECVN